MTELRECVARFGTPSANRFAAATPAVAVADELGFQMAASRGMRGVLRAQTASPPQAAPRIDSPGGVVTLDGTAMQGQAGAEMAVPRWSPGQPSPPAAAVAARSASSEVAALTRRLETLRPVLREVLRGTEPVQGTAGPGTRRPLRPLPAGATTLAVRNIPSRYGQKDIEAEWLPNPSIEFLELAYDLEAHRPASYAFVDFTSNDAAREFQIRWHGSFLSRGGRSRALDIACAKVQGYQANMERLAGNLNLFGPTYWPATFSEGARLDTFGEATEMATQRGWGQGSRSSRHA